MWHFDEKLPRDAAKYSSTSDLDPVTRTILRIGNISNNARLSLQHPHAPVSASSRAILSSTSSSDHNDASICSRWVGQPTDVAMLDLLDHYGEEDVRENIGIRIAETPFSSERKWMGVIIGPHQSNDASPGRDNRETAYIKGAVEQVLRRCDTYLSRDGREVVLDEPRRRQAREAAETMAQEGLRVLGFATGTPAKTSLSISLTSVRSRTGTPVTGQCLTPTNSEDNYQGLVFAGLVGMSDPPRKGVEESIRRLMKGGVRTVMITGDAETTAVAIGRKLGIPISAPHEHTINSVAVRPVLRGEDIDDMSPDQLKAAIAQTSIFARTSPEHKLKIIHAFQARGDVVAMTGDGVNDAPALKKADIGIAMGMHGTDVAKEAADMVLTDDDFSTILRAIEEGKSIFYNIQNFLTFQLSTSAAALSLVLVCTIFNFKNPLNAMQILWISKSLNFFFFFF
jgi:Ca2+-transporting ATPase